MSDVIHQKDKYRILEVKKLNFLVSDEYNKNHSYDLKELSFKIGGEVAHNKPNNLIKWTTNFSLFHKKNNSLLELYRFSHETIFEVENILNYFKVDDIDIENKFIIFLNNIANAHARGCLVELVKPYRLDLFLLPIDVVSVGRFNETNARAETDPYSEVF